MSVVEITKEELEKLPRPAQNYILCTVVAPETKTAGGIVIPEMAQEGNMLEVLSVGPEVGKGVLDGVQAPSVEVGDHIVIGEFSGRAFEKNGVNYWIIRDIDVMAFE